ncbi:hypothetical protein [Rubrivivax sp. A210]|uniref:hypothetical protein n=1 Tax=Rubrivivax sp. A210 TaxID=2772301 RepID=UPI001919D9C9|nr:hypothetical protein [Rubrivivax sp. A210]
MQLTFSFTIFAVPVKPVFAAALLVFATETISVPQKKSLAEMPCFRWQSFAAAPSIIAAENWGRNSPFQSMFSDENQRSATIAENALPK